MVEYGRVTGKARTRASIQKLSRRVPEKVGKGRIPPSIEKLSRRVPKNGRIYVSTEKLYNMGEYREKVESVRVAKNCPGDFQKMVKFV